MACGVNLESITTPKQLNEAPPHRAPEHQHQAFEPRDPAGPEPVSGPAGRGRAALELGPSHQRRSRRCGGAGHLRAADSPDSRSGAVQPQRSGRYRYEPDRRGGPGLHQRQPAAGARAGGAGGQRHQLGSRPQQPGCRGAATGGRNRPDCGQQLVWGDQAARWQRRHAGDADWTERRADRGVGSERQPAQQCVRGDDQRAVGGSDGSAGGPRRAGVGGRRPDGAGGQRWGGERDWDIQDDRGAGQCGQCGDGGKRHGFGDAGDGCQRESGDAAERWALGQVKRGGQERLRLCRAESRWLGGDLGQQQHWRQQQRCGRAARQRGGGDLFDESSGRRAEGRRLGGDLGQQQLWWQQQRRGREVDRRGGGDLFDESCLRRAEGRRLGGDLGR